MMMRILFFKNLSRTKLEDIRTVQKQRARQKGVSAASLALGKKVDKAEEITDVRQHYSMFTVQLRLLCVCLCVCLFW